MTLRSLVHFKTGQGELTKDSSPPATRYKRPGHSFFDAVSYFRMLLGLNSRMQPVATHPTRGNVSHMKMLRSRLFCMIGFVMIPSNTLAISMSLNEMNTRLGRAGTDTTYADINHAFLPKGKQIYQRHRSYNKRSKTI